MKIHQAYFGDDDGSHNLLSTSINENELIATLKLNTDVPGSITLEYPYLSGRKIGNHYVFTKTMKDISSNRPGMVFSHCLIIPIAHLDDIKNIHPLFQHFLEAPNKEKKDLQPIEFVDNLPLSGKETDKLAILLDTLIQHQQTVIYPEYEGFENLIAALLSRIPLTLKKNFSFTISGSPNEIQEENYTLVHVPKENLSRFRGYPTLQFTIPPKKMLAQQYLFNEIGDDTKALNRFISENEIVFEKFHQLSAIVKCYELVGKLSHNPDLITLKRIINSVNRVISNPQKGKTLKKQILNQFTEALVNSNVKDFKILRNMTFSAYENGQKQVAVAAKKWAHDKLSPSNKAITIEYSALIVEAYTGEAIDWWNAIVKGRFEFLCKNCSVAIADLIWKFWISSPELISIAENKIEQQSELLFLQTAPKNIATSSVYSKIIPLAKVKKWYLLHAHSVAKSLTIQEAITVQLKFDKTKYQKKGLEIIAENVETEPFVLVAAKNNNSFLHEITGKICAKSPQYLSNLSIDSVNWQAIWYNSYLTSNNISNGIEQPKQPLYSLLDLIVDKKNTHQKLLKVLAQEFGNIYTYPKRSAIWDLLDTSIKKLFLAQTAVHVLENYITIDVSNLESPLLSYMKSSAFVQSNLLTKTLINISNKIKFLQALGRFREDDLITILKAHNNQINHFDADFIAKIILRKNWKKALNYIYDQRYYENYFYHIVSECKEMFGFWRRISLDSKSNEDISLPHLLGLIDKQKLQKVFSILDELDVNDSLYNRLKDEYIAGVKGIELNDLSERLKTYIQSLESKNSNS